MTYDELAVAVDALECKDILGQHTCEKVNEARYCYYRVPHTRTKGSTPEEANPLLAQATREAEAAVARAHEAVGLALDKFRGAGAGGKGGVIS